MYGAVNESLGPVQTSFSQARKLPKNWKLKFWGSSSRHYPARSFLQCALSHLKYLRRLTAVSISMSGNVEIDAVVEARTDLGESPVWDERTQMLYFIDINSKRIHVWDNKSKSHDVIDMLELVGTIIPAPKEDQLVVALTRRAHKRRALAIIFTGAHAARPFPQDSFTECQ